LSLGKITAVMFCSFAILIPAAYAFIFIRNGYFTDTIAGIFLFPVSIYIGTLGLIYCSRKYVGFRLYILTFAALAIIAFPFVFTQYMGDGVIGLMLLFSPIAIATFVGTTTVIIIKKAFNGI